MCSRSCAYFIDQWCHIEDTEAHGWIRFDLWPAQLDALEALQTHKQVIILKARQLGFTWLVLGYALWLMLFRASVRVLLFSKRDEEAIQLLSDRLKGMHSRLPPWLQCGKANPPGSHTWSLPNGSKAQAFPTTGGRSYTAGLVVVDEADYTPDLQRLLNAVKPTIDHGGQIILLSTADKDKPESAFKGIYRAAEAAVEAGQESGYWPVFHGWQARPERTPEWYEKEKADSLRTTGTLDNVHQEYPATSVEALAPRELDKRIPPAWVNQCYEKMEPIRVLPPGSPALAGLVVYKLPEVGRKYVVGADPAEGNPTSDDSALIVLDVESGEEVASLAGKVEPAVFGDHINTIARWYNKAPAMVERANHGHAVLMALRQLRLPSLRGYDLKDGWLSTEKGKHILYDACAEACRDEQLLLHSFATVVQLQSIEGNTLRAPEGMHDDRADAAALAVVGAAQAAGRTARIVSLAGKAGEKPAQPERTSD